MVVCCLGFRGGEAWGGDLTDEMESLYSSRFFIARGRLPVVTVGLMDGQRRVSFSCPKGGVALLYHRSRPVRRIRLRPRRVYRVTIRQGRPAKIRYWSTAFRVRREQKKLWKKQIQRWKKRGVTLHPFEVGTVFGLSGRVIDNRWRIAAVRAFAHRNQAQQHASALASRYRSQVGIFEELLRRPAGTLTLSRGKRRWVGHDLLKIRPHQNKVLLYRVEYGRGYRWHGYRNRRYRGSLLFTPDQRGKIVVVNRVRFDHLLRGLVPAEMPSFAPLEALKAQAICARGDILAKIGTRHLADPYLICASTHCQVYSGLSREQPTSNKAVAQTRGEVMFLSPGRLADAYYSAVCGGHSENNEYVWPGPPNPALRGKPDLAVKKHKYTNGIWEGNLRRWLLHPPPAYCQGRRKQVRRKFRWRRIYQAKTLNRLINRKHPVGYVLKLQVKQRGISGRVRSLHIVGRQKSVTVYREWPIRKLLGGLFSGMFLIQTRRNRKGRPLRWTFLGGGWGHGVGLCQYGAIERARRGQSYRTILQHYFSNIRLLKIY